MTDEHIPPAVPGSEPTAEPITAATPGSAADPETGPALDTVPGPVPEPYLPPSPAPETKKPRRRLALGLAAALVAVAAGGGTGYAVLDQGAAVKATGKPWKAPLPQKTASYGAESGGSHYGALRKLLLPMPQAYVPGPDVAEFGNDAQLSGKRASDLLKAGYRDLPKKQRLAAGKAVDRLGVEGIGLRTYSIYGSVGVGTDGDDALVVEIELLQLKNKQAARGATDFFSALAKEVVDLRKGPKIAGYGNAVCVLPPRDKGVPLDRMDCEATEGDLVISLTATGTTPLPKEDAVALLKQQLDRVKDPGEAA